MTYKRKLTVVGLVLGGLIYASGVILGLVRAHSSGWTTGSIIPLRWPLLVSLGFFGEALVIARGTGSGA